MENIPFITTLDERMKTYTKAEGFTERDLIHFGMDHLKAARTLCETRDSRFMDSAGYLSQLGVELLLKACLLDLNGEFPNEHKLTTLYTDLKSQGFELTPDHEQWLAHLDDFAQLRYPRPSDPVPAGTEDWDRTDDLLQDLFGQMPSALEKMVFEVDRYVQTEKGSRILFRKKEDHPTNN